VGAKSHTPVPGRATRNLTIGFGLVSVPVSIKPIAESSRPVSGKYVCPQHGPNVAQRYLCSEGTPQEHLLSQGEQVTAYEHPDKKGEYVVVEKDVLTSIEEEKTGNIAVTQIVDEKEIDPLFYVQAYLVWPQPGQEQRYDLFSATLREQGRAAVATIVLTKQTQTLVIRWSETTQTLVAHTCRFESQIRWADAQLVSNYASERPALSDEELELARFVMESMYGEFHPGELVDNFTPLMQDAIRSAASGVTFTAATPVVVAAPKDDLLEALKASVVAAKGPVKKPAAKSRAKAKA